MNNQERREALKRVIEAKLRASLKDLAGKKNTPALQKQIRKRLDAFISEHLAVIPELARPRVFIRALADASDPSRLHMHVETGTRVPVDKSPALIIDLNVYKRLMSASPVCSKCGGLEPIDGIPCERCSGAGIEPTEKKQ